MNSIMLRCREDTFTLALLYRRIRQDGVDEFTIVLGILIEWLITIILQIMIKKSDRIGILVNRSMESDLLCQPGPSSVLGLFEGESSFEEVSVDISKPVSTPSKTVLLTTWRSSSSGSRPSA